MGWTSYHATNYKNGKVDRKAECDGYFLEGLNRGYYRVLKSAMVGSVYYAAVQPLNRYTEEVDGEGNRIEEVIPEEQRKVWAVIFLTSVRNKEYFNFSYKDMMETCGPCECKCPVSILKLLSETFDEYALEWRRKCWQYYEMRKSPDALSNLPAGSVISFGEKSGKQNTYVKHPPAYQFKQAFWYSPEKGKYIPQNHIPNEYKILSRGVMEGK